APLGTACDHTKSLLWSDQDWQGMLHHQMRTWYLTLAKRGGNDPSARPHDFTIFKFRLRTVYDAASPFASWLEANGQRRLCFGPEYSKDGKAEGQCPGARLLLGDPNPDNS
ncbi:hypothetical protein C8A05DRAFT_19873, partial [Staphylotrichum tortipilum]